MDAFQQAIDLVYRSDYSSIADLIRKGLDINARDDDGRSLLMHASLAERPSIGVIELLVRSGAKVDAIDAGQSWSALHFAARDQKVEVVSLLLREGATVDIVDDFGNTPLWRAAMNQFVSKDVITALLRGGADPRKVNKHGVSPLDVAISLGNAEVTQLLEDAEAG